MDRVVVEVGFEGRPDSDEDFLAARGLVLAVLDDLDGADYVVEAPRVVADPKDGAQGGEVLLLGLEYAKVFLESFLLLIHSHLEGRHRETPRLTATVSRRNPDGSVIMAQLTGAAEDVSAALLTMWDDSDPTLPAGEEP